MRFRQYLQETIPNQDNISTSDFIKEPKDWEIAYEISSDYVGFTKADKFKIKMVDISDLTATQDIVRSADMKKSKNTSEVEVVIYDGVSYLVDGHHRVAKAYYSNKSKIKAKVIEIYEI